MVAAGAGIIDVGGESTRPGARAVDPGEECRRIVPVITELRRRQPSVLLSADSWFLHTMLDRAWIDYTRGKLQLRLGRQRINWGTNLVWNPNDVFNTFSYFDFDYEEDDEDMLKIGRDFEASLEMPFVLIETEEQ